MCSLLPEPSCCFFLVLVFSPHVSIIILSLWYILRHEILIIINIYFHYFFYLRCNLNIGKGSKKPAYKKAVETGTANDDVDYEWIPRSALRTPGKLISKAINRTKVLQCRLISMRYFLGFTEFEFFFYRKQ